MGPVERELRAKQSYTYDELVSFGSRKKLSRAAMRCMSDAAVEVTGMRGIADYYLREIFSEAIAAAEALGL